MKVEVHIEKPQQGRIGAALIRQAAMAVLKHAGAPKNALLSIVLTGDEAVQALNERFMGIDAPTDVLSFPSGDDFEGDAEETYLGDVIISLPRAGQQAEAGGHALEHEVQLLAVHGCLHLLGYDHAEPDEKDRMWAAQAAVLAGLGNPLSPP